MRDTSTLRITSRDYLGRLCVLCNQDDGRVMDVGEFVKDFRGDEAEITGGRAPHKMGSTGRVYVTYEDGTTGEYYPGVFNLEWQVDG